MLRAAPGAGLVWRVASGFGGVEKVFHGVGVGLGGRRLTVQSPRDAGAHGFEEGVAESRDVLGAAVDGRERVAIRDVVVDVVVVSGGAGPVGVAQGMAQVVVPVAGLCQGDDEGHGGGMPAVVDDAGVVKDAQRGGQGVGIDRRQ